MALSAASVDRSSSLTEKESSPKGQAESRLSERLRIWCGKREVTLLLQPCFPESAQMATGGEKARVCHIKRSNPQS